MEGYYMRTSATEVEKIIVTGLTEDEVDSYILSANTMVTQALGDSGLSDNVLTEIEKWLTAHFIACTRVQQVAEGTAGPASVKYQGKTYTGMYATFYGQQATLMDTTGTLKSLGSKTASMYAVGSFANG